MFIEYFDLLETDEEGSPLLREWMGGGSIRRAPPPTPAGFAGLVRPGDRLQLLLDEAFWDVTVEEVAVPAPAPGRARAAEPPVFVVSSTEYEATHRVAPERLRPLWLWHGAADGGGPPRWRYELMAGTGVCEEDGAGGAECAVFVFAEGLPRRHNAFFLSQARAESEAATVGA